MQLINVSKLLLIDATLAIGVIPLFLLIQGRNIKSLFIRSSKRENLLGKTSLKLPKKGELIKLEKITKIQGSGIESDSLVGNWYFVSVWKKDTEEEDSIFSLLLRIFAAKLELKKNISTENRNSLDIIVSIQFGILSIEFSGNSYLKGSQPIMFFLFNIVQIKSGQSILLERSLKEPAERDKSFFALIGSGESGRWLSGRGQGDSIILWFKN